MQDPDMRFNFGQRQDIDNFRRSEMRPPTQAPKPLLSATDTKPITKLLDKITMLCIMMIFFGVPLFFTSLSFQGIAFDKQMYFYFWLFLGLVAWVAKGVIVGEINIQRTALDLPILGFWLAYLVTTVLSIDRWHSFWGAFGDPSRGFVSITAFIIAYYMICSFLDAKRLRWALGALLASGFLAGLWTILVVLGVKFMPASWQAFSPISLIGSLRGLGIFFSLMLPLIVTAIIKIKEEEVVAERFKKIGLGLLYADLAITLYVLLALYAYTPWIGLLVGVGIFLIFILAQIVRPRGNMTLLPMLIFVLILVFMFIGNNRLARINLPLDVMPGNEMSTEIAKEAIKKDFFFGTGPATYGYVFSQYKPESFNQDMLWNLRFYQGKGIAFESLPTIGAVGIITLALVILSFIGVVAYNLSRDKERNKIYSLGLAIASLIFIIDLMMVRVDGGILILGIMACALALVAVFIESETERKFLCLSLKASPKYALTLAFIFMVVSSGVAFLFVYLGKLFVADVYAGSALRQPAVSEEGSLASLGRAIQLYGKEGRYFSRIGQEYMFLANQEALKPDTERDVNKITNYLNLSIAASTTAKNLLPTDVFVVENLAQIYENSVLYVAGSVALAEENYKAAQALEPGNPLYNIKLGQLKLAYLGTKKEEAEKKQLVEETKNLFQKAVDLKNNYDIGWYNLFLAQEGLGNLDDAINSIVNAVKLKNGDVNYLFNLARVLQSRGKDQDNNDAEIIYKEIVKMDDKQINVHFNLGTLYEKMKRKDDAIAAYQKVLSLIPNDDQNKTVRDQLNKVISNVKAGIPNTPENIGITQPEPQPKAPENVTPESVPPVPGNLNPEPAPTPTPAPAPNPVE